MAADLRRFFELYAYQGVDTPVLENLDLFLRKSGDEMIARMYSFTHWNRKLCLRPEFTASVMRAYVNGMQERPLPLRLHYAGPTFRYEKPQRGRSRQFTQVGVETIGASGALADAELLQLACGALESVGLRGYRLVVGHLGAVLQLLEQLGISPHGQTLILGTLEHLARRGAEPKAVTERIVALLGHGGETRDAASAGDAAPLGDLVARLGAEEATRLAQGLLTLGGLPLDGGSRSAEEIVGRLLEKARRVDPARPVATAIEFIGRLHRLGGPPESALPELRSLMEEYRLDTAPLDEIRRALEVFACYGTQPDEVVIDLSLGRGLRYYTGLVFEIYQDGAEGPLQLCGGGRYDDLVRSLGGRESIPACGFSFGLERVDLALSEAKPPPPDRPAADVLVAPLDEADVPAAIGAAEALRREGVRVELEVRPRGVRAALRRADRAGIPSVALLGERERAQGEVVFRQMGARTEERMPLAQLAVRLRAER